MSIQKVKFKIVCISYGESDRLVELEKIVSLPYPFPNDIEVSGIGTIEVNKIKWSDKEGFYYKTRKTFWKDDDYDVGVKDFTNGGWINPNQSQDYEIVNWKP